MGQAPLVTGYVAYVGPGLVTSLYLEPLPYGVETKLRDRNHPFTFEQLHVRHVTRPQVFMTLKGKDRPCNHVSIFGKQTVCRKYARDSRTLASTCGACVTCF